MNKIITSMSVIIIIVGMLALAVWILKEPKRVVYGPPKPGSTMVEVHEVTAVYSDGTTAKKGLYGTR